jgi:hypothetical protein
MALEFFALAQRAGLEHDEHDGYERGDWFTLKVVEFIHKSSDLQRYHAAGRFLGLVAHERKRVYARRYRYGPSYAHHAYVVGENESGTPFAHAVPAAHCRTLEQAMDWIWQGNKLESRQGDVGIAACTLKHVRGEEGEVRIINSHIAVGEIRRNGGLYLRHGFIVHTKNQHPRIHVGNEWKKIVVARRSGAVSSSKD